MIRKEDCERRAEELLIPICEANGFELVDVEYVKEAGEWYLRAYIDKEGGVNINDCVDVNHALSDALDEDDFIDEAYTLEVSSPGLGRQLKKDRHLEKSIGKEVELRLFKPQDGTKEFAGVLKEFDDSTVTVTINEKDVTFIRKEISVIKLALDF